jgi:acid phosphatase
MAPPDGCRVNGVALYIRHSEISANDDEWDETMESFLKKLAKWQRKTKKSHHLSYDSPFAFLSTHTSPVNESVIEKLTPQGGQSAFDMGGRMRGYYSHLLPNASMEFEMWTADATRDVLSARGFMKGLVPDHHGGDGSGDGHVKVRPFSTELPKA